MTSLGIARQEEPRGRIVPVGIGIGVRVSQLADAAVGLIPESDAVDQRGAKRVIAQQWSAVGEFVESGDVEPPGLSDPLPHLIVQAFDQAAVGFPMCLGVAVLREHVRRRLVLPPRDELGLKAGLIEGVPQE